MRWEYFDLVKPEFGDKIVIVCNDGCSTSVAMFTEEGALEGEDGWGLADDYMSGSIWAKLPDSYSLRFTEITQDDWQ